MIKLYINRPQLLVDTHEHQYENKFSTCRP